MREIDLNAMSKKALILIILIIIVLYGQSLKFPHLLYWDNAGYSYTQHPIIHSLSFTNLKAMFTRSFDNHYHPFTLISLAIDYSLGHGKAVFFRITNLFLLIFIGLFLFIFIYKLLRNNWAAAFISLFFVLHPFNVESVVWISERKNLLFMFFLIPSLIYYLEYIEYKEKRFLLYSCLFFIFSLFSKSQGLPMIGLLFVIDYIKNRKFNRSSIKEKIPYLIIGVVFLIAMFYFHVPANFERTHPHRLPDYLFTGFRNVFFYVYKTLIPFWFSPYYSYPQNPVSSYWFFPVLFILCIWLIFKYFKRNRLFIAGLLFYFISIFPLLKFFPIPYGNYIAADRHMILPIIGLAIAFWSLIVNNVKKGWVWSSVIIFLTLLFGSSYYTISQWKNSQQFYTYLINRQPEVVSGWGNRGRVSLSEKKYNEAIRDFSKAIKIKQDNSNLYLNRGLAYAYLKKFDSAYFNFSEAIRCDSSNFKAYSNRSLTLIQLKKPLEALNDITCSIILNPNYVDGWINKAFIEYKQNNYKQAIESINRAIELNPQNIKLQYLKNEILQEANKNKSLN
ncbi:MAG TPA: tetratricopeptide repeat protein [Bacteroidales bacterium]|nr:tetratricopeptide repeat protein [Bacteroidales bacterium]